MNKKTTPHLYLNNQTIADNVTLAREYATMMALPHCAMKGDKGARLVEHSRMHAMLDDIALSNPKNSDFDMLYNILACKNFYWADRNDKQSLGADSPSNSTGRKIELADGTDCKLYFEATHGIYDLTVSYGKTIEEVRNIALNMSQGARFNGIKSIASSKTAMRAFEDAVRRSTGINYSRSHDKQTGSAITVRPTSHSFEKTE